MEEREYLRSLHRCPLCGKVVGLVDDGENLLISTEKFSLHVAVCREKAKGKTGKVGPDRNED